MAKLFPKKQAINHLFSQDVIDTFGLDAIDSAIEGYSEENHLNQRALYRSIINQALSEAELNDLRDYVLGWLFTMRAMANIFYSRGGESNG